MTVSHNEQHNGRLSSGVALGFSAYLVWGFFPLYFKLVAHLSPLAVICHRILWSCVFLSAVVVLLRRQRELVRAVSQPRVLLCLCCSTLLIAGNWLVFLYAVSGGHVLQSSLGYFINPLISVLLGFLFLGERLQRWQNISLLLALAAVVGLTLSQGQLPWVALVLALTFGTYGLLRKQVAVDALIGLTVETWLLAPPAVAVLWWLQQQGVPFWGQWPSDAAVLVVSGVVTAIPLLLFAAAARRLRLATIGFLQYITPTLHFLQAVVLYHEPFTLIHGVCFGLIWLALLIYSWASLRRPRYAVKP